MSRDLEQRRRDDVVRAITAVGAAVAVMWVVEVADQLAFNLDQHGIRPRDPDGLAGILAAPFLHGGFGHLLSNTIPLLVLGAMIALSGLGRVLAVAAVVALVGGLGTWVTGPAGTVHIGASGLVFGFAAYLIARALYSRALVHLAGAVLVVAVWGFTLLGGLVPTPGVSWQGHLFGAIGGLIAARLLHRRDPAPSQRSAYA